MSLYTSALEWFLAFIKRWIHVTNVEGLEHLATAYQADSDPTAYPSPPSSSCALSLWGVGMEECLLGRLCRLRAGVPLSSQMDWGISSWVFFRQPFLEPLPFLCSARDRLSYLGRYPPNCQLVGSLPCFGHFGLALYCPRGLE